MSQPPPSSSVAGGGASVPAPLSDGGKHRVRDAARRRKESGLIRQLERWTSRDREQCKAAPRSGLRDQGRVAVLQDSVDLISRLQDLNTALTSACNAQEERMQVMAVQLQIAIHSSRVHTAAAAATTWSPPSTTATTTPTPAPLSESEAERKTQPSLHHSTSITTSQTSVNRASSPSSSSSLSFSSSPILSSPSPTPSSSFPSPSSTSSSSSHPLSALPSRVSDALSYLSARHSLYSSLLGDSRLTLLLVDSATGMGLDANDAFCAHSRYSRHQLMRKLIIAPYTHIMQGPPLLPPAAPPDDSTPSPPTAKRRKVGGEVDDVDKVDVGQVGTGEESSASGEYAECSGGFHVHDLTAVDEVAQAVPQWPRSLREMRRLYAGEVGVVQCVWRCRLADGLVREQQWVSWVAKRDAVVDQLGRVTQQPVHTVYAAGFDDAHVVQRWHSLTA